jgi:hypothetical protein
VHVRALTLSVATALALAFLPATAGALTSFPVQRAGSGKEPTAGGGSFRGVAFAARSAAIQWDANARTLTLYLFELPGVQCSSLHRTVAIKRGRSVQVLVARRAVRLPVGRTLRDPFVRFARRFGATDVEIQLVQQRVRVRFTRIDTHRGGVWHGHLDVAPRTLEGNRYSYAGTFAARWCS